ncbi:MAG: hypothetical protein KKC51_05135 [Verrucomicrobia bacterium]|nr:hypothetical protein [Verrucomicrobiota bacterium]
MKKALHKIAGVVLGPVCLLLWAGSGWADSAVPVDLVQVGKSFVTTMKIRRGDSVRILVKQKGDGLPDAIVISSYTPAQARLTRVAEAGVELKRWLKQDVETGQVLVYTVEESANIGVGIDGSTNSRQDVVRVGDHFEITFSSITERWILEVKFTTPEF